MTRYRPRGRPARVARLDPATNRPRTVYIDDATFEAAKALGDGSASAGIRVAIQQITDLNTYHAAHQDGLPNAADMEKLAEIMRLGS